METDPTIVEYTAGHERYRCGYCGSKDTNYSHGMWAHQMTVADYQALIDRGWRRSGMYCYKPTMNLTCCPQYTIRCHPLEFKLNKSHKKVIKRVNKFLISGVKPGHDSEASSKEYEGIDMVERNVKDAESAMAQKTKPSEIVLPHGGKKTMKNPKGSVSETTFQTSNSSPSIPTGSKSAVILSQEDREKQNEGSNSRCTPTPGTGPDPSKPKCKKAKEIRAERRMMKQSQIGDSETKQKKQKSSREKSLEDFLREPEHVENPAHKLEIALCRTAPESLQFRLSFHESYAVYRAYQMAVHKDPPEECDKFGFKSFLVDSPLEEKYDNNGPPDGYGSFHQHYLLDGKLIAVGVVDILPSSVSSVYLYYDPEYSFLGLGVYSALREIALVRELNLSAPDLKYYYMGFYIHNCQKMRYKGQYRPSFLACPETYEWVPIEKCRPKLDVNKYCRLSESGTDKEQDFDVNQVLVLHKGNMLPYGFYKVMTSQGRDEDEVREYASLVGKTCAERMLLVRK
ncbi:unnamed protein product [Candidula unifasciata]|uniref:Arginyl-tRNA--protein transferase 1 n=1 Tax=Candidula unifasciata TaxID=100452 RepID=A0A8S3ZBV6_9EUPU|nr:unnamed protein product [Candidula unifasciata]